MADQIINRRENKDRRSGKDRRKFPRRMSDIYPPPGSEEWKKIVIGKLKDFANEHLISLSEFKMLVGSMEDDE